MSQTSVIDDSPILPFHQKLRVQCGGGTFLDGYLIASTAVALPGITSEFGLSTGELSFLAAISLVGIFLGSMVFGAISDRIGRHTLFTWDLVAFAVLSASSLFVDGLWQIALVRLLVGVAIGADYPLAMTMVSEWMPRKYRAGGIGMLVIAWFGGAAVAYIAGAGIVAAMGDQAWNWVLASATVPAVIVLLLRVGMPESPRWLLSKGRDGEALTILRSVYGPEATLEGLAASKPDETRGSFRDLFSPRYARRTLFASGPYTAQTTAFFVILTFEPTILLAFGLDHGNLGYIGSALTSLLFLLGCVPVMRWAESFGRRRIYIASFALMTVPLLVLGLVPIESAWIVIACFCVYALVSGPTNVLSWSYPNELFPTYLRATGVGFSTAMTRIGATIGTFMLPIVLETWGTRSAMLLGAAVVAAGLIMCILWAPETQGKTLDESSAGDGAPVPSRERQPR